MSGGFNWAERLGAQTPPAQPPAPVAAPSNRPWWQTPTPQPVSPQQVVPTPQAVPLPTPQQASVAPDGQSDFGTLLRQDGYTTDKAQSTREQEFCPDCGSTNYMSAKGHPNAMKTCFECGFNPRFTQSMAGMSGTGQNIPVKTARVQQMNTSTFNPQAVIAHIG